MTSLECSCTAEIFNACYNWDTQDRARFHVLEHVLEELLPKIEELVCEVQSLQTQLDGLARTTAATSRITNMFTPIG